MLQKSRVSSSKSRRSETRSEPEFSMYRSATMVPKDSASKRQDFPKPKPPSLKPTLGHGKPARSLEYNSEGNYRTSTIAARQSGQSKSGRPRILQNPEGLVNDLQRNRRVRSNTWTFDHSTGSRREVTLLELRNGVDMHANGRPHRLNSEGSADDRLRASLDEPRAAETLKR